MGRRARGEGQIRRRHDGRWEARVRVTLADGRHKRVSICGPTQKGVAAKLLEARKRHAMGLPAAESGAGTVGKYLSRWLDDVVARRVRPRTLRSYRQIVDDHLIPRLGPIGLAKLRPDHVDKAITEMLAAGLAPRTGQYALTLLRMALKSAERRGDLARNVAKLVDAPRVARREVEPLEVDEAGALLKHLRGHEHEALVLVALGVGLRSAEILGLRWQDVDLEARTIRVGATLEREPGEPWRIGEVKSSTSRRTLALPAIVATALKAHQARQRKARMHAGPLWHDHGFVFARADGEPLSGSIAYKAFQAARKAAGVARRQRFHDLRHSAASFLIAQGAHPKEVQEQLGHSTIVVTMDTYGHLLAGAERKPARRMDAALRGATAGGAKRGK